MIRIEANGVISGLEFTADEMDTLGTDVDVWGTGSLFGLLENVFAAQETLDESESSISPEADNLPDSILATLQAERDQRRQKVTELQDTLLSTAADVLVEEVEEHIDLTQAAKEAFIIDGSLVDEQVFAAAHDSNLYPTDTAFADQVENFVHSKDNL